MEGTVAVRVKRSPGRGGVGGRHSARTVAGSMTACCTRGGVGESAFDAPSPLVLELCPLVNASSAGVSARRGVAGRNGTKNQHAQ